MKCLMTFGLLAVGLVSCVKTEAPRPNRAERPHGAANRSGVGHQSFAAGQFVVTIIDNASFFNDLPMGEARPDLLLFKNTSMRIIAPGDPYAKVELDNGQIGHVMMAMLVAQPTVSSPKVDGEVPPQPPHSSATDGIPIEIDPQVPGD